MTSDNSNSICLRGLKNRRLDLITDKEAEAAAIAYEHHKRNCRQIGIAPQSRQQFVAEWLECRRLRSADQADASAGQHHLSRDYRRQFYGKSGFSSNDQEN